MSKTRKLMHRRIRVTLIPPPQSRTAMYAPSAAEQLLRDCGAPNLSLHGG